MMTTAQLSDNLKSYIAFQVDSLSKGNPLIGFFRPLIIRAVDKNFNKITGLFDLLADEEGNIDVENILSEMLESVMNTNPFTLNTSFIGDIEIGGGQIKLSLPFTNKRLVLDTTDLETFKEMLTTKS